MIMMIKSIEEEREKQKLLSIWIHNKHTHITKYSAIISLYVLYPQ